MLGTTVRVVCCDGGRKGGLEGVGVNVIVNRQLSWQGGAADTSSKLLQVNKNHSNNALIFYLIVAAESDLMQNKLKPASLGTDWIENERFGPVVMKTTNFMLKTGSINSGTVLGAWVGFDEVTNVEFAIWYQRRVMYDLAHERPDFVLWQCLGGEFTLQPLRRYVTRNFTFDTPCLQKVQYHRVGSFQFP